MTILQGLIASISRVTPAAPPSFNPVDSGISLGTDWTVEIIGSFSPTNFWATIWGNEVWNEGKGHLAYLNSPTYLNVGAPNSANEYVLAQDVSVKSYWVFTHSDGGGINVYRNGQLLTPNASSYNQPSSVAPNTLLWGARHSNDGTGTSDPIGPATYDYYNISGMAQDATWVQTQYNNLSGPYGI